MNRALSCCPTLVAIVTAASYAQVNENDVLPCRVLSDPALLATGDVDVITGEFTIPAEIFGELVIDSGADDLRGDEGFFTVTDPGLYPPGYGPLPGLVDLRFDFEAFALGGVTANLWLWEPAPGGLIWFRPAAGGEKLSFQKSPTSFFNATVSGEATGVSGFVIDRTSSSGGLHKHLIIVVDDGDTSPATPVTPAIYAASYTLSHPTAGSPPVFEVVDATSKPGGPNLGPAVEFFEGFVNACPGDASEDGVVGLRDFATVQAGYGIESGAARSDGDFNADGDVDVSDVSLVIAMLGTDCP